MTVHYSFSRVLLLCWLSVEFAMPQDSGFVQNAFSDLTINMGPASVAVQTFEGARNSDPGSTKVYAFSPYFEFLTYTGDGKAMEIIDLGNDKKTIKMRLALYDDTLKSAAASWISQQTNAAVSINSVLPLPIFALTITENNTGASAILPEGTVGPNTSLSLSPAKDIFFRSLSSAMANQLQTLISNKQADFSFTYFYKTSSNTLGAYTVTYDDVHKNSVFNQLTGAGGVGFVTRAGVTRLSTAIAQSMTITSYCEDSSCTPSLVQDLITLFTDKMQFNKVLTFTDSAQMATLDNLTIDPRGRDFEAQTLNTIHDALTTSHDYNELNHKILDAHLKGGYGPFNADAGFTSNDEVNKAIKDTFAHDWTGNDWSTVPKTINVYQINGSDFQGSAMVRQISVKATFSMRSFQSGPIQSFLTADALATALKAASAERFVLVPVGTVLAYSGPVDATHPLPGYWLVCDGSPLSKTMYPDLFAAIGTTYGDGRDQNNNKVVLDFNLPDYKGYFLRGVDNGSGRDKGTSQRRAQHTGGNSGAAVGSIEEDQVGGHAHPINDPGHQHAIQWGQSLAAGSSVHERSNILNPNSDLGDGAVPRTWPRQTGITVLNNIDPATSESRPMNASVYWIIRSR